MKLLSLQLTLITFGLLLADKPSFEQIKEDSQETQFNSQETQFTFSQNPTITSYQQPIDRLLDLLRQRLLIQNDVARWKWNQNRAIEAPEREQELLAKIREQAPAYGLDPDSAVIFFQWQVFAGKQLQVDDFQVWQKEGIQFFDNVPDLGV